MRSGQAADASFAVVTDSTADISKDTAARLGIEVVPLSVIIDGQTFRDGELSQSEFFALMNSSPTLPTTSQPPIGEFVAAYERALAKADEVISLHIGGKLSGTLEAARQGAERFADRVHVFDSRTLSWALGFLVQNAVVAASEGLTASAALARLERTRERVKLIVGLDNLDNLAKGGRIGRLSAFMGSMLNIKVTFSVAPDGSFAPEGRSRGEKAALAYTLEWVAARLGKARRGRFAIGYAMVPERAEWLKDRIAERFEAVELLVYETGCVIATHTGTGWGVAFEVLD